MLVGQLPPSPVPLNPGHPHLVSWSPKGVACGVVVRGGPAELAFSKPLQGLSDSKPHLNSFRKSLPHQLPLENRASPWPSGVPPWSSARRALRAQIGVFLVEMRSATWVRTKHDVPSWWGQALDQRDMRMMGFGDTSLPGKTVSSFLQSGVLGVTPTVLELLGVRLCDFSRESRGASVSALSLVRLGQAWGTNSPSRNHV